MALYWYAIPPFALEPFEGDEMSDAYIIVPAGDHTLHVWLDCDEITAQILEEVLVEYPYVVDVQHVPTGEGFKHGEFTHYLSVIYEPGELLQARGVIAMHCKYLDVARSE